MRRYFKFGKLAVYILLLSSAWLIYIAYAIVSFGNTSEVGNADVAIVLGAAVMGDAPSPVFKERITHAITLYRNGVVRKLIFTGGYGEGMKRAEAEVARDYAVNHGVDINDVLIETTSNTTKQNILNARQLMMTNQLNSALIVSDPLHMKRAMLMARDAGLIATSSPTMSTKYQTLNSQVPFLLREMYFYHHYFIFDE